MFEFHEPVNRPAGQHPRSGAVTLLFHLRLRAAPLLNQAASRQGIAMRFECSTASEFLGIIGSVADELLFGRLSQLVPGQQLKSKSQRTAFRTFSGLVQQRMALTLRPPFLLRSKLCLEVRPRSHRGGPSLAITATAYNP